MRLRSKKCDKCSALEKEIAQLKDENKKIKAANAEFIGLLGGRIDKWLGGALTRKA